MCFSPAASFTAGALLAAVGIITVRKTQSKGELLLASIPLLFAVQQCTEGVLWLLLLNGEWGLTQFWVTQVYAVFVGVVWPVVIPLSLFLIEPDYHRKRIILAITAIGAGVAIYAWNIIMAYGVSSVIANSCILYDHPVEQGAYILPVYLLVTCLPFFCSSYRSIVRLGIIYTLSFIAAYHFYEINYVSVWCFFGAIVSAMVYRHFSGKADPIVETPAIAPARI